MKTFARIAMLVVAATLGMGASKPLPKKVATNWNFVNVATPEGGHRVATPRPRSS